MLQKIFGFDAKTMTLKKEIMGLITWVLLHLLCGKYKDLNIGMVILATLFILKYAFL